MKVSISFGYKDIFALFSPNYEFMLSYNLQFIISNLHHMVMNCSSNGCFDEILCNFQNVYDLFMDLFILQWTIHPWLLWNGLNSRNSIIIDSHLHFYWFVTANIELHLWGIKESKPNWTEFQTWTKMITIVNMYILV